MKRPTASARVLWSQAKYIHYGDLNQEGMFGKHSETSQNQKDWRARLEKEGTRTTVEFQVARIIQYHGQENARERASGTLCLI